MPFLTHTQLRHGAWGSACADSANSNRGVFAGAREGVIAWQETLAPQADRVIAHPVADPAGNLYFATAQGALQARTPEGAPILVPHGATANLHAVQGLHFGPGATLVAVCDQTLACLGLDGAARWRIDGFQGGRAMIAPDGQTLFVAQSVPADGSSVLVALGLGTGIEHWRLPFPGRISGPAVNAEGTLYLLAHYDASPPYRLLAIDGGSGDLLWQQKIAPMQALFAPRLFGDELVLVVGSESLQAFHRDGRPAWAHTLHDPGSPAVSASGQLALLRDNFTLPQQPSLWLCWPDGLVHREAAPPPGMVFMDDPVFDAAGNLFLVAQDQPPRKLLLKYSPDLELIWSGAAWEDTENNLQLAVLPEAVLLSAVVPSTATHPPSTSREPLKSLQLICIR